MAINRLQFRRDSIADFITANDSTRIGEPVMYTDDGRLRVSKNAGAHMHQMPAPIASGEGIQFHTIWNCSGYNNAPYCLIPATRWSNSGFSGERADTAESYVFSGSIPDRALQDAAVMKVYMAGDFEQGSSSPAMNFRFNFGNDEGTSTDLFPQSGGVQRIAKWRDGTTVPQVATALESSSIEISAHTLGPNVLHYDEKIRWELEATVHFMGYDNEGEFETSREDSVSDQDANVRITGKVRWGLIGKSCYGNFEHSGFIFGGFRNTARPTADINNDSYSGGSVRGYPRHYTCNSGGNGYRAVGPFTAVSSTGGIYTAADEAHDINATFSDTEVESALDALASKLNKLTDAFEDWGNWAPGTGRIWQEYWQRTHNELDFCFEENVDLRQEGQTFSVKVGGPLQNDLTVLPARWTNSDNIAVFSQLNNKKQEQDLLRRPQTVAKGDGVYAPRFNHTTNTTTAPGPDDTLPDEYGSRFWFKLSDDRRDIMRVHSSTAYLIGGRSGVGEYNPL